LRDTKCVIKKLLSVLSSHDTNVSRRLVVHRQKAQKSAVPATPPVAAPVTKPIADGAKAKKPEPKGKLPVIRQHSTVL